MTTTGQAASSTSNFQSIIDALANYAKITGIDLSDNAFAATLGQSNSFEDILQLLQGREKDFKEYRDGDRRLINCLRRRRDERSHFNLRRQITKLFWVASHRNHLL